MAEEHLTGWNGPCGPTDSVIARFPAQRLLWAVAVGYVLVMVIPAVMLIQPTFRRSSEGFRSIYVAVTRRCRRC